MRAPDVPLDRLLIPAWVPSAVAAEARSRLSDYAQPLNKKDAARVEIIVRLATHPDMREVWNAPRIRKSQDVEKQNLFVSAFLAAQRRVPTRREVERERDHYLNLAADLRRLIPDTDFGSPISDDERCLRPAIRYCEKKAEHLTGWFERNPLVVVERKRGSPIVRTFAIQVVRTCRRLFRAPMHRVVAVLATVALGRDVDERAVKEWAKPRPKDG